MKYQRAILVEGFENILDHTVGFEFDYLLGGSPKFIRFYLKLQDVWSDGSYENGELFIMRQEEESLYSPELLQQIKEKCEYIMLRYDII